MKKLFIIFLAVAGASLGAMVGYRLGAPEEIQATVFNTERPLPEFNLTDHHGQPFNQDHMKDHWRFVFFGFTHCPDVCPTTLLLLSQVKKGLSDIPEEQQPKIVMFSVDPARDTPEQLANYVPHFGGDITGVTGGMPQIQSFTSQMGVAFTYTPNDNGSYTVDHTASIFLVGPDGQLKALFTTPHERESIIQDYKNIMELYES